MQRYIVFKDRGKRIRIPVSEREYVAERLCVARARAARGIGRASRLRAARWEAKAAAHSPPVQADEYDFNAVYRRGVLAGLLA